MTTAGASAGPSKSRLQLDAASWHELLTRFGPSLGLWRAAEIAILRRQGFASPVLDLGCGDGTVTSMVLDHVDVGLDPWEAAVREAARHGTYGKLMVHAAQGMPLSPGSIGTVLSNSVLEHLEDVDAVLGAAAQVLRPGGHLILTVPSERFPRQLVLPLARYAAWRNRSLGHRNLWPLERWRRHLERVGLRIIATELYLRPPLVTLWDLLELMQQLWIGDERMFSLLWRRLSRRALERLAHCLSHLDFGAGSTGGGRLIVAEKLTSLRQEGDTSDRFPPRCPGRPSPSSGRRTR